MTHHELKPICTSSHYAVRETKHHKMASVAEIIFYPPKRDIDHTSVFKEAAEVFSHVPGAKASYHGVLVEDEEIHCIVLEFKDKASFENRTKVEGGQGASDAFRATVNMEHGLEPFLGASKWCIAHEKREG